MAQASPGPGILHPVGAPRRLGPLLLSAIGPYPPPTAAGSGLGGAEAPQAPWRGAYEHVPVCTPLRRLTCAYATQEIGECMWGPVPAAAAAAAAAWRHGGGPAAGCGVALLWGAAALWLCFPRPLCLHAAAVVSESVARFLAGCCLQRLAVAATVRDGGSFPQNTQSRLFTPNSASHFSVLPPPMTSLMVPIAFPCCLFCLVP